MLTPDDDPFESYLKRFHPIAPEPIGTIRVGNASRRWFAPGVWVAAAAAILIVGSIILIARSSRVAVPITVRDRASVAGRAPIEPLTIRSANAWLATSPSFQTAVDELAFRSKDHSIPRGKQSAIAALSEERPQL